MKKTDAIYFSGVVLGDKSRARKNKFNFHLKVNC